ncbi:phospholipid carrier-dependent glycosyltransferase [candidate division WWE3 bacterium]|nr:phospholipid carrier-dependent glycosyltransferase [candidate division WWE3 bacterium]
MKISKFKNKQLLFWLTAAIIVLSGTYLRLHAINFGLPHSFHADEPEIVELAVKYTYQIRNIMSKKEFYRLIPISFVYGMFPTYILTLATMSFSKGANLLNFAFEKQAIYVFLRSLTALTSLSIIPIALLIYKNLFNKKVSKLEALGLIFLTSLNWKLIVHSHYVNMDIFLTLLINGVFLTYILYFRDPKKSLWVILSGILFGFAVGTKITAVLSLPWLIYIYAKQKDWRSLFAFLFLSYIGFAISNPFSLIFAHDFAYRIFEMQAKEAGMVFDSVNLDTLKYLKSLIFISTPLVFLISLYGNLVTFVRSKRKEKKDIALHIFLTGNILTYLLFFSLNAREVGRWLLPILPLVLVYAAKGIVEVGKRHLFPHVSPARSGLQKCVQKNLFPLLSTITILAGGTLYLKNPLLLLKQFNRHTPKSESYEWARDNLPESANKLAITEEGLDPLNKLQGIRVIRPIVYTTENAQFDFPPDPIGYDYVILSSKPMNNYKREEVQEKYPFYSERWEEFETTVKNPEKFQLIKEFTLPKPNLVNLSDVHIYENKCLTTKKNYCPKL